MTVVELRACGKFTPKIVGDSPEDDDLLEITEGLARPSASCATWSFAEAMEIFSTQVKI